MPLLIAAHGTRDPVGVRVVGEIAAGVRARLPGVRVEVAYVDVLRPSVADALDVLGAAVVVPAFLADGYHVRVDVPAQVGGRGWVTPALGPDVGLVVAAHDRLLEAGWRGEPIVLAAAGSSVAGARAATARVGAVLASRTGVEVRVVYVGGGLASAVAPGWAVASWLLAPGLFHRLVRATGAPVVAAPLGTHPHVLSLITTRYLTALPRESNIPARRVQHSGRASSTFR